MADPSNSWGVAHLSQLPVTYWYAAILFSVLIILVLLRAIFGQIRAGAGGR